MTRPASFLALTFSAAIFVGCDSESTPTPQVIATTPVAPTVTGEPGKRGPKTPIAELIRKPPAPPKRTSL
jgi:hypothetical protein